MSYLLDYKKWNQLYEQETQTPSLNQVSAQENGMSVENISISLNNILDKSNMGTVTGLSSIYAFPMDGTPKDGDVAVKNTRASVYSLGGNNYVAVGLIGNLKQNGKNWTVVDETPKVFTFSTTDSSKTGGAGSQVRRIAPFSKPSPAENLPYVIAKLIKTFVAGGRVDNGLIAKKGADKFISEMVAAFKLAGMKSDIENMDDLRRTIINYV